MFAWRHQLHLIFSSKVLGAVLVAVPFLSRKKEVFLTLNFLAPWCLDATDTPMSSWHLLLRVGVDVQFPWESQPQQLPQYPLARATGRHLNLRGVRRVRGVPIGLPTDQHWFKKKQHKTTQNNILHCWASFATRSELYTLIVMLMRFDVQSQIINLPWGLDIH